MSETAVGIFISLYCLVQIVGCFFIGRAIFRIVVERKKELKQKPIPVRKASND